MQTWCLKKPPCHSNRGRLVKLLFWGYLISPHRLTVADAVIAGPTRHGHRSMLLLLLMVMLMERLLRQVLLPTAAVMWQVVRVHRVAHKLLVVLGGTTEDLHVSHNCGRERRIEIWWVFLLGESLVVESDLDTVEGFQTGFVTQPRTNKQEGRVKSWSQNAK